MNDVTKVNPIDKAEELLISHGTPIDCPLKHRFLPGLYIREIFMPAGTEEIANVVTSLMHNTTHPFFLLKGKVSIFTEAGGIQMIEAPYIGTTTPGTRRVLLIHEDCIWATVHPTSTYPADSSEKATMEAVQKITDEIIDHRENPLLNGQYINNYFIPSIPEKELLK